VCTNPDHVIPRAGGGTALGPGAVAHAYADLGGSTFLYGKPHPPIYEEARSRLGDGEGEFRRIVAIGDLIETDIRGARGAGIASVLVTRGSANDTDEADMVMEAFAW
jgi:ribonucleotide monophosphatase NagD (HAD superfamily)